MPVVTDHTLYTILSFSHCNQSYYRESYYHHVKGAYYKNSCLCQYQLLPALLQFQKQVYLSLTENYALP